MSETICPRRRRRIQCVDDTSTSSSKSTCSSKSSSLDGKSSSTESADIKSTSVDEISNDDFDKIYKNIIDRSPDSIITINMQGIIMFANPATTVMFEYTHEELIGNKVNILMQDHHAKLHDHYLHNYYSATPRHSPMCPRRLLAQKKSGVAFPVQITIFESSASHNLCTGVIKDLSLISNYEKAIVQDLEEKNMFATNISHELRSPLNSILNMNYLMGKDIEKLNNNNSKSCQHCECARETLSDITDANDTIRRNCTILHTQINDILDFAKLDSGKVTIRKDPLNIRDCVDTCRDIHSIAAKEKGLEFVTSVDADVPTNLLGDSDRIIQILMNILSNAIKFTDSGKITLKVSKQRDRVVGSLQRRNVILDTSECIIVFTVIDTGIGIKADDRIKLFHQFTQLNIDTKRKRGGTGLGLAITKKLCMLMGGDAILHSSEPGIGSTFVCTVKCIVTHINTGIMSLGDSPAFPNAIKLASKRILIVDNDENNIMTFAQYAIEWGMVPFTATSGRSALIFIKGNMSFDIALIDYKMPNMNGLELSLRMKKAGVKYPIISLTSDSDMINTDNVFEHVLVKPINKAKLFRVIYKQLIPNSDISSALTESRRDSIDNISTYADALSDEDSLSGTNNNSMSSGETGSGSSKRISLTDSYEEHNLKILIAEDDPDHQKVLRRLLKTINCTNVTIVSDGKQALDAITFQQFDIAFIDINMPVLGGIELMKSVLPMPNRPVMIAVTAVGTYGERSFYVNEIHFDEYLSKPIYAQSLFELLRKYDQ